MNRGSKGRERWGDVPPGVSSERAEFGLALFFQILSLRAFSAGDSWVSTFGLEPPLLSLWKLRPRERARLGEVGGWSMLMF